MAMGLININNLFIVGVVFNEEGKHIRDKIKGFKLNFDSLVKWTLASRSGKNIFTVLIISICLVISYFYLLSHIRVGEIYKNEVESTTIDLEKSFLKSTVNNLIRQIESDRKMAIIHYIRNVDNQYAALNEMKNATADVYLKSLYAEFGLDKELSGKPSSWTVLIWDDKKNIIYAPQGYNGQDITVLLEQIKPLLVHYRIIENQGISCLFGYSYEHVDNTVKAATAAKIKSLQFENGSYVWVNEVVNYEGGDNYAIRRVHPNLPQTEGMYLSTEMTDLKGNHPYLTELEGIKKDGELFFRYYFKELDSDIISEKLTYAKLYKDYNWIVAMGIQSNVMEAQIAQANKKMQAMAVVSALQMLFVLIVLVLFFLAVMLFIAWQQKRQMELDIAVDPLTNAKSRKYGLEFMARKFDEYRKDRNKSSTAVMMLDVDNFKQINDRYGHHVGDQALQEVVKTVARAIRSSDELFRLGGDEFVGIFYGVSEENTPFFAGKILEAVAALEIRAGDEVIRISVSIGVSYFRPDDGSCSEALKRADEAMYISKKKGGNQLTIL